jgi:hypothetical protein
LLEEELGPEDFFQEGIPLALGAFCGFGIARFEEEILLDSD